MARVADSMTPGATLPRDGTAGVLAGRVWRPEVGGPSVVTVRGDGVWDISKLAPTLRDLAESADAVAMLREKHVCRILPGSESCAVNDSP